MSKPSYVDTNNDAAMARLIKTGAIFVRESGTTDIPTSATWVPQSVASIVGYYSDDGFSLTPNAGDTTELTGHNGDPIVAESAPGFWALAFAALEGNKTTTETYFDVAVAADGSITVTTAAANKRYDIVTVGVDQLDRPIVIHYPNVQISEREGVTFNRTTLLALGMTFRTFKGSAAAPYMFKAWGLASAGENSDATGWTVAVSGSPSGGTYRLIVDGFATPEIAHDADNATITAAVNGLSGVTGSTAAVTGTATKTLTFTNAVNVQATSALTGGTTPGVVVTKL
ncbi:hypothetical protein QBL02_13025 [Leucobacter sp. UT-8R-CII-1-4]|uniref:hypothetical protein n=1 Tax=Leucobacter sp. UT-8R-CII-1-4 TaxID=3040075 RepID=UPI0024A83E5D|nr:hypothetical protein [Leucobacter sp. UT-8R-CII-1-4]MDI6024463.1 hypothetical protein [Leucobacter sp. UT-8R-CII-1-4]